MTWVHPALLWFLILPVAGLLWTLVRPVRENEETLWPKISRLKAGLGGLRRTSTRAVIRVRPFLMWIAVMLGIIAQARPQWGETEEQVYEHAREVLIALDLSRSMLVSDVTPSRLERSKLMIQSLLDHLEGERVGLIVFAGTAFLQSPLSADYQVLRGFLPELDPDYLPQGGTDYEEMLQTALDSFGQGNDSQADRFLIVLSDGESLEDNWKPRANELRERKIQVIALGVGTNEGGLVPDEGGGLMKDTSGAVVLSRLDDSTLQELAQITHGTYRNAAGWIDLNDLITETVAKGRAGRFLEERAVRRIERFQWFLLPAVLLALLSLWRELPALPRSRHLQQTAKRQSKKRTVITTATLVLLVAWPTLPSRLQAQAAPPSPEPPDPKPIAEIITRLVTQTEVQPEDWGALARETITFGQTIQQSGQPVPVGPVFDAIQGVSLGEASAPDATDWENLRQELLALLEEPDQQEQNQENEEQENQDQQQEQDKQQNQDQQSGQQDKQQNQDQQSGQQDQQDQQSGQQDQEQQEQEQQEGEEQEGQSKEPEQDDSEMQTIGGESTPQELPDDPELAAAMQELEQVRNQDSPARLFRLLEGEPPEDSKTTKNW